MTAPILPTVRVDLWELRCHYKKAHYPQRIAQNEFREERGKPRTAHQKYNLGPGGVSITVYYYDRITKDQLLEVHRLERSDGTLGHRKPDPKIVVHNGVIYRRHGGSDDILREPELRYRWIWQRKIYGLWRKARCFFFGPMHRAE
jgi:hypothetical protein